MAASKKKQSTSNIPQKDADKEEGSPSVGINSFANDGSFMALYKKRMEELEKAKNTSTESDSWSTNLASQGEGTSAASTTSHSPATSKGSLLLQGKRKLPMGKMGGASKQLLIKKKKEEKELKKKESKETEKATGWDLYMQEVKKYRETTCSEEVDRVRPLVK